MVLERTDENGEKETVFGFTGEELDEILGMIGRYTGSSDESATSPAKRLRILLKLKGE